MKILKASNEFTAKECYQLTRNPDSISMKEMAGQDIQPAAYCMFEDVNSDGEQTTLLSIISADGRTFTTNSETFQREFTFIADLCAEYQEPLSAITVITGTAKSGREYVSCKMAQ